MKRSEINNYIREAIQFFDTMGFHLPPWAFWRPDEWKGRYGDCAQIVDNMLGWDITDFGRSDFRRCGLLLFTIRNGNFDRATANDKPVDPEKPYAEKIMIVREDQETPYHFHWHKMEDIINRGGGNLILELAQASADGKLGTGPVQVSIDGVRRTFDAGERVSLRPGESITLTPNMYHRFYGENGNGTVLTGEVSMVNDDLNDNRFLEEQGRFPQVEEDEQPLHLMVSDYRRYL